MISRRYQLFNIISKRAHTHKRVQSLFTCIKYPYPKLCIATAHAHVSKSFELNKNVIWRVCYSVVTMWFTSASHRSWSLTWHFVSPRYTCSSTPCATNFPIRSPSNLSSESHHSAMFTSNAVNGADVFIPLWPILTIEKKLNHLPSDINLLDRAS